MTFRKHLRRGLVARGTNHVIRGLDLSVPPSLTSKEGRKDEFSSSSQLLNQTWLCSDVSIKHQKDGFGEFVVSEDSNQDVATKVADSKTKARSRVLIKHLDSNLKKRIFLAKTELCSTM